VIISAWVTHLNAKFVFLRCLNVIGAISIYAGLFLYEDEDGQFQNRVQQWWVRTDDLAKASCSKVATFMRGIARLTAIFLDRLFGRPVYRHLLRLIGISICFSMASAFLSGLLIPSLLHAKTKLPLVGVNIEIEWLGWFVYFLALALVPALYTSKWWLRIWGVVVASQLLPLLSFLLFLFVHYSPQTAGLGIEVLLLVFSTSLFCDVLYISLSHICLSTSQKLTASVELSYLSLETFYYLVLHWLLQ